MVNIMVVHDIPECTILREGVNMRLNRGEFLGVAGEHPEVVKRPAAWIQANRTPHRPQEEPSKPEGQRWR